MSYRPPFFEAGAKKKSVRSSTQPSIIDPPMPSPTNMHDLNTFPCEAEHEQRSIFKSSRYPKPLEAVQGQSRKIAEPMPSINLQSRELLPFTAKISGKKATASTAHHKKSKQCLQTGADTTPAPSAKDTIRIVEWAKNLAIKSAEHAVEQERVLQDEKREK